MRPQAGARVGRYVLRSKIGQGGMAEVWAADDPHLSRVVAIKLVLETLDRDDKATKRFVTEARALAALEHPHILPVYDFGEESGSLFIVMPLVKGGTLTGRMKEPTPPETAVPWLRALASALDFAHARKVIHRDVKPGNILFDEFGKVLLNDFGIAKREGEDLTTKGGFVGTFGFMPPEQMLGQDLDGSADQYSLGVVAFQLLTASFPFPARTMSELVERAFKLPPASAHKARPSLPPDVDEVFLKVLAKKAPDRYASCAEFVEALESRAMTPSARIRAVSVPVVEEGGTERIDADDLRRLTIGVRGAPAREAAPPVSPPPAAVRPRASSREMERPGPPPLPPSPPQSPAPARARSRSAIEAPAVAAPPVSPPARKRPPSVATAPIHPRALRETRVDRPPSSGLPVWAVALVALVLSVGLVFALVKLVIQPAEEKKGRAPAAAPRPDVRPAPPR